MKVVIFAGGRGSRLGPETDSKPKPLVEVGGKPILWHIMKGYIEQGFNDFIVLLGYKGYMIKEYFANYRLHNSDCLIRPESLEAPCFLSPNDFPAKVFLLDTGEESNTAHRLLAAEKYIDGENFMMTYGDGVSDVDLLQLAGNHMSDSNPILTITAIRPESRFGVLNIDHEDKIVSFVEKPASDQTWVNGGFMMAKKEIFRYIDESKNMPLEDVVQRLVFEQRIEAFRHDGFWGSMDTPRDRENLERLWKGNAPWRTWK